MSTQLVVHNEYAGLVMEFAAKVTLAAAIMAADPDAENEAFEESIDLAHRIYDGLNEVHSSLELFVESIPEGSLESASLRTAETDRYDRTADSIIRWQRQINRAMYSIRTYADADMAPKDAAPVIEILRNLPQRPS